MTYPPKVTFWGIWLHNAEANKLICRLCYNSCWLAISQRFNQTHHFHTHSKWALSLFPCRYNLIAQCWVESPAKRYSFEEITEVVNALLKDVAGYIDFSAVCNSVDMIASEYASQDSTSVWRIINAKLLNEFLISCSYTMFFGSWDVPFKNSSLGGSLPPPTLNLPPLPPFFTNKQHVAIRYAH